MPQSTQPAQGRKAKPNKPRADFPLFVHASGKWAKTIKGRTHYFGRWADPEGALQDYLDKKDNLYAGRTPQALAGLDLAHLCSRFMDSKEIDLDSGKLSPRTFMEQ